MIIKPQRGRQITCSLKYSKKEKVCVVRLSFSEEQIQKPDRTIITYNFTFY